MGRKETVRKSGMRERLSRLGCVLLCVCLLTVSLFVGGSAEAVSIPFSGSGTPEDPYLLTSAEDLKTLADRVNRVNNGFTAGATSFALTADIDMADIDMSSVGGETQWTPIGIEYNNKTDRAFKYRFDGRNHTIRNFVYHKTGSGDVGLFGLVGVGADIRNLVMDESCEIQHSLPRTGALIGRILAGDSETGTVTLANIGILASVSGTSAVGGLFGRMEAKDVTLYVSDCYVAGTVSASSATGNNMSVFGYVYSGKATFSNCYYLEGCASGMTVSAPAGSESRTETDFTSGKVAYELRKKTTGTGNAWGQNLPGETRPHPGSAPAYWDDDRKRYFNLDRIRSVSIALGTDLTARFYCYMSEAHDNDSAEMRFLWHGEETVVKMEIVKDEEPPAIGEPPVLLRMFSFRGICSQCMNDPLTAVLQYNDGETVSELDRREDFRVVDYAVLRLNATNSGTEKQILADMIAYGSASQVYAQYRTDALAKNDSAYLDALRDSGAAAREDNPPAKGKTLTGSATAAGSCWKSAALYFDYNQRFALRFLAAASDCSSGALTVKETRGSGERIYTASDFAAEDGGIYRLLTDPFSVKDFGTDATYELRFGDNTVQTLTYGVNVWCYTVSNGGDAYPQAAKDLAAATYRYGASAAAYAADHS